MSVVNFSRTHAILLAAGFAFAISLGMGLVSLVVDSATLADQRAQIAHLSDRIDAQKAAERDAKGSITATGGDAERIAADTRRIEKLVDASFSVDAEDREIALLSVVGLTHHYMVVIEVGSPARERAPQAASITTLFVATDEDGEITDVSQYASATGRMSSR